MKVLSMYLPQFHRVKENDEWWGPGFTEWTTVNNATKLYPEHYQPREPKYQYDLLEKTAMIQQAELMKEYGIDGFCIYHYYFEDGRKILEKPVENLLLWKDVDIQFCFYWANESWIRSWSNMKGGNSWSEIYDTSRKESNDGVLLRQNYGGKKQWKSHFEYLLPFFQDKRYIRYKNQPVFIIYKPEEIECLAEMKECWNQLMEERGLPHIYFIGKNTKCETVDATLLHEPQHALGEINVLPFDNEYGIRAMCGYDQVWNEILKTEIDSDRKTFLGGFVGYDDSPRRGKNGTIILDGTPEKFKEYLIRLFIKAARTKSEFVFLNAWNEWGEGMYLEPDKRWGNGYLQALKDARIFVECNNRMLLECISDNQDNKIEKPLESDQGQCLYRYKSYWQILDGWLKLTLEGRFLSNYFVRNGYKKIALYGIGMLGENLIRDMENNNLDITFGIDQDVYKGRKYDFPIYTFDDDWDYAEIIVVTVDYAFEKIKEKIQGKVSNGVKIISISQMIKESKSI